MNEELIKLAQRVALTQVKLEMFDLVGMTVTHQLIRDIITKVEVTLKI